MKHPARLVVMALLGAGLAALAPNLLWLQRSSALVRNAAATPQTVRLVLLDGAQTEPDPGGLAPGAARFAWIPARGDATLLVEQRVGGEWVPRCQLYVEGSGYRVEVVLISEGEARCDVDLVPFGHLLLADLLR